MIIGALNGRAPALRLRLQKAIEAGATLRISAIAMHELAFGVAGSRQPEKSAQALALLLSSAGIAVLAFDEAAAAQAGRLRAALRARGEPIGPFDTLIAGHALSEGATLVTANVKEFARCEGLTVVDWTT